MADGPDSVIAPVSSTNARLAISSAIAEFCSTSNTPRPVRLLSSTIRVEHLLDHDRRETERGFVEHQEARMAHQGAADRQHLLLAAR